MAYVSVPKDLSKVKSKIILNLTKRQLVCFGSAAAIGLPIYFLTRGLIGNSSALMAMIVLMLPAFFMAMYEKDGQPAEKILKNILRCKWYHPSKRPYKTENLYHLIEKEGKRFDQIEEAATAGTTLAGKHQAGKGTKKAT